MTFQLNEGFISYRSNVFEQDNQFHIFRILGNSIYWFCRIDLKILFLTEMNYL